MNAIHNELLRFALLMLVVLVFALATGFWLIPIIIGLLLYIGWMLHKLHQLENWVLNGFDLDNPPYNDGAWANISEIVFGLKQTAEKNKVRQKSIIKQFSKIIAAIPNATLVINDKNEIIWLNRDAARLLKLHHKKDLNRNIINLIRAPKLLAALNKKTQQRIKISSPVDENITLNLHISRIRQSIRVIVARDVSHIEQLEDTRKAFVANASHELRTPLTVIIGYLELLKARSSFDAEAKTMLESSYQQAHKMNKLLTDLMALSKLENRELSSRKSKTVNMVEILQDLVGSLKNTIGAQHEIIISFDKKLAVIGSKNELYSLIDNLVTNAIKHTPAGTRIEISWQRIEELAVLKVTDNGPGILPEDLPHLTERFYQVNKAQNRDGIGLGLSIVKHIVQRHGASLDIESEPDEHTSFTITFPEYRGKLTE